MHIVGLSLLIFVVLPELDVVKGAMITNCLCFIPAVLQLASRHSKESRRFVYVLYVLAIGSQCRGHLGFFQGSEKLVNLAQIQKMD